MTPYKELLNYGIAVAILIPVMIFLLWAGRAVVMSMLKNIGDFFKGLLDQQKEMAAALKDLARSFLGIQDNCRACRNDSLTTLRTAEVEITRKFVEVTAASHDKLFAAMQTGFNELASSFDSSLTGTANSVRKDQEALVKALENKRNEEKIKELERENEELSQAHDVSGKVRGVAR